MGGAGIQSLAVAKKSKKKPVEKQYVSDHSHGADKISVTPKILTEIRKALAEENNAEIIKIFSKLRYPDQAILFESTRSDQHNILINAIYEQVSAQLLYECLSPIRVKITKKLGAEKVGKLLEQMNPEDAIDFLSTFSRAEKISLLKNTNLEKRKLIRSAINSPENSAASISHQNYIVVDRLSTIKSVIKRVQELKLQDYERLYDIFVSDSKDQIVGVVDVVSILCADRNLRVESIAKDSFITVKNHDSTRDVVCVFNKYGINTAPVLEESGRMVGAITIDTIRYIADEQGEEDLLKLSGVLSDLDESLVDTTKIRFVWLLVNLITTAFASWIISFFESTIHQITALAVLMPITVSMGSNAGTQTVVVIIRAIATKHLNKNNFINYFNKEVIMSLFNGLVFAAICIGAVYLLYNSLSLAIVFGVAIALTIIASVLSGVVIPIAMKALGTDPAITSVVFLTAIIDVVAFVSFLGLAKSLLT
ncbi:MAG: magnesium transporter [Alphaproteobacteria bacterium]|nr:magnesium transporter [Rickettsiales bacterium]